MEHNVKNIGIWESSRKDVTALKALLNKREKQLIKRPCRKNATRVQRIATAYPTSCFYSEPLEKYYTERARNFMQPLSCISIHPNSILHVVSTCFLIGGHTRILERWIHSAPESEIHSVIITSQRVESDIPEFLRELISASNGSLILQNPLDSEESRAHQLRALATSYENVILHHHTYDPIPLMAFGLEEFKRPVILFNHAGHLFWIGRNAVDLVIDFEQWQQDLTHTKRGIKHSVLLQLPYATDTSIVHKDKNEIRNKLTLPKDAHIIISMASAYKYTVIHDYNYPRMLAELLGRDPQSLVVIIGVTPGENTHWDALEEEYKHRLILLGHLPHDIAVQYLLAADVYLDSFPYGSNTSLIDAITIGNLPALSLLPEAIPTPAFIAGTYAEASNREELIAKALELLSDPQKRMEIGSSLKSHVEIATNISRFQAKIQSLYKVAKDITKEDRFTEISDEIPSFDLLSNALARAQAEQNIKTISIGSLKLVKRHRSIYLRTFSLFGLLVYKRQLTAGHWKTTFLGISIH